MLKYYLIAAFCLWQGTGALYFHIAESERKCFIEEIPDETTVLSLFTIRVNSPFQNSPISFLSVSS